MINTYEDYESLIKDETVPDKQSPLALVSDERFILDLEIFTAKCLARGDNLTSPLLTIFVAGYEAGYKDHKKETSVSSLEKLILSPKSNES